MGRAAETPCVDPVLLLLLQLERHPFAAADIHAAPTAEPDRLRARARTRLPPSPVHGLGFWAFVNRTLPAADAQRANRAATGKNVWLGD